MPLYSFYNEQSDEVFEKMVKISELDSYLADNPHIQKMIDAPHLIGGISMDSGRLPDGFKDKLREIKKKHPHARGINHLL